MAASVVRESGGAVQSLVAFRPWCRRAASVRPDRDDERLSVRNLFMPCALSSALPILELKGVFY
jgi:hypothetical protein